MECSWNDGSKTQYYVIILYLLQDHSRELEQALESHVRGLLTDPLVRSMKISSIRYRLQVEMYIQL